MLARLRRYLSKHEELEVAIFSVSVVFVEKIKNKKYTN